MLDLICIKVFLNRFEAELAKNLLEDSGINSVISADDCGGLRPDIGFSTGNVSLLVGKDDYEKAKEILRVSGSAD